MDTNKRKYIMTALILCVSSIMFGQSQSQAKKWFAAGEYEKAKPVFAKLVKSNPRYGSFNYWYGVCLNETGEHEAALPYLKKAVEREVENAFRYIGDYYLQDGEFELAIENYEIYLEKVDPTDTMFVTYTRKVKKIQHELKFYKRVEKVAFVDSVIIPKEKFLTAYKLGEECGKIGSTHNMLGGKTSNEGTAYRTDMRDKIYYSDIAENGCLQLFMCYKMLDNWSNPTQLKGLPEGDNNYPFVLSDGITIYFANNNPQGLGGYDIYVTRYNSETDRYLVPENLGMPFNSTANDYMLVIDEINNLGWFATDRNQTQENVCVYTFIPAKEKQYYNYDEEDFKVIRNAANIHCIAATQDDKSAIRKAEQTLFKLNLKFNDEEDDNKFNFVIDDFTDYHTLDDFKNIEARHLFINWEAKKEVLKQLTQQLEEKRSLYFQSSVNERRKMKDEILHLEKQHEQLETEVINLPLAIRNLEINHKHNK